MKLSVNGNEYLVIKLLGKGKGGYSFLVSDGKSKYVLKKIHHEPCSYYEFGNKIEAEISSYNKLKEIGILVPELIEVDVESEHILKQFIDGKTVYEMLKNNENIDECLEQVKTISDIASNAGINIDYFPTNFVLENGNLYYIDYECNNYLEQWNFVNWGINYWSKTDKFIKYVNQQVVRDFFTEGYINHNYEKVIKLLSDNYIDNSPANAKGAKGAVEILKIVEEQYSEMNIIVQDLICENEKVAVRLKYDCTYLSKHLSFEALEIFKIEDGKIVESWGYWPDEQIKKQLE